MKLSQLHQHMMRVKSIDELSAVLEEYLKVLGIHTFAFTYYSYHPSSKHKIKFDYASQKFLLWHQHYLSENYDDIDSTADIVYQTTLPICWDLQKQLREAKTAREKKMRKDSIAFGAEKGLSIPIHGPNDDFAILVICQMRGEKCLENWFDVQYELMSVANVYYHYLRLLLLSEGKKNTNKKLINKREMQCLMLIAQMVSIENMAKIMHITERTVNYHIQRLNKKFGTQNKYQTVMKAIQLGLINL